MSDVTFDDFAAAHTAGTAQAVDVREPAEYIAGHVPGATSIPMGQLPRRLDEIQRSQPVFVICESGRRSSAMTAVLRHHGFDAHSVIGGTAAWRSSRRQVDTGTRAGLATKMISSADSGSGQQIPTIIPIETPTLGDRSYLVHDGDVAFVVDPQRDIDRVLDLATEQGVRISHVFETHIHNDYVTGGLALAERVGARYFVNAADEVAYDRTPISDAEEVSVGTSMVVRALATPGHTFSHLSYALTAGGEPVAVFTGGSLLYGATGRPDLLGHEHTQELVHAQYTSAHRLATELPDATEVFPTHGLGSFCSATQSDATDSTIGAEKRHNPVLTSDEETYVAELLAGLDAYPAYYVHMAPANTAGPSAPDLSLPAMARPDELRRRIEAGEWVVDLRHRTVFAAGHVPGTLNFGIDGGFATYLGWLIEWGTPVTLLGETEADVATAQRELVRIGIERPAAAATGGPQDWSDRPLATFRQATFADLDQVRHHRDVVVLDVRRQQEFAAARIEGAVNIPLHELPRRVREVPDTAEVWVHCAGGYRASVAASFLSAAHRRLVAIDDTFANAELTGLHLITSDRAEDDSVTDDSEPVPASDGALARA